MDEEKRKYYKEMINMFLDGMSTDLMKKVYQLIKIMILS